jgi:Spy/CpxP family protein refolding chaperone
MMKFRLASILAGTAIATMTLLPFAAEAGPNRLGRLGAMLNLTEAQQAQIEALHGQRQAQLESILTQEQRDMIAAARESGNPRRSLRGELNLTPDQREQLRQLRESARGDFLGILTPEQREQLETMRANRGRRGGRGVPQG